MDLTLSKLIEIHLRSFLSRSMFVEQSKRLSRINAKETRYQRFVIQSFCLLLCLAESSPTYFFSSICGCHSWLFRYPFCQTATVRTEIFHAETPNSVLAFVFQSIHLHVVSNTPSNHALKSASLRCFIQMHYVRNHLSEARCINQRENDFFLRD